MFQNRSKAAFFAVLIALLYGVYSITYWTDANASTSDDAEAIGAGIATFLVLPHVLTTWVGILFGLIGYFSRKTGFLLTAAILYSVAAVLFFLYAIFLIPSIVLGFVGYSSQKKMNKAGVTAA